MAGQNMANAVQAQLVDQKRPMYLHPVDKDGNSLWDKKETIGGEEHLEDQAAVGTSSSTSTNTSATTTTTSTIWGATFDPFSEYDNVIIKKDNPIVQGGTSRSFKRTISSSDEEPDTTIVRTARRLREE